MGTASGPDYDLLLVSVFWAFAVGGFRRYAQYRAATFAGAFTNSVFGLLRASISIAAVTSAGGRLLGYDDRTVITYAWLSQAVIAPVHVFQWTELADRIRSGDVVTDLTRPVDLQVQLLAADLGRAAYLLLPRGLPPLLVGALTFGLTLPSGVASYLLGAVSLVLAVVVSFACRFLLNLSAFWLLDLRGPTTLYVMISNVLCGLLLPVWWLPGWLRTVAAATPFPSMVQAPVDLFGGRVTDVHEMAATVAVQAFWAAVTLLAGRLLLRRATSRVVVQGG